MGRLDQVIRWGIPGWMFVFFLLVLLGLRFVFTGNDVVLFVQLRRDAAIWQAVLTAAAAGTAGGVPFGYFLYQFYYFFYWSPVHPFKIAPLDRGYSILKDVARPYVDHATNTVVPPMPLLEWTGHAIVETGELPGPTLGPFGGLHRPSNLRAVEFSEARRRNWNLAQFVWEKTVVDNALPPSVDTKADNLINVFHSLGASRAALFFAYWVYFAYELYQAVSSGGSAEAWQSFYFTFANLSFAVLVVYIFSQTRWDTLHSYIDFKHDIITYYHRRGGARPN